VIDDLWVSGLVEGGYFPIKNQLSCGISLLPTSRLKLYQTWMSARLQQAAGKQAVIMLKAATEKRRKQLWMLARLQRNGLPCGKLQSKIDRQPLVKPDASRIKMELDSRFVDFREVDGTTWIRLSSIGRKIQIRIPLAQTAPSRKWGSVGERKQFVRLSSDRLWLVYAVPDAPRKGQGTIGADQGVTTALTLSSGATTQKCPHGHDLASIQRTLSGRKKGSEGFRRAQEHRKNYIGWSLNQLRPALAAAKMVNLERVKHLRRGVRSSRFLSHWTYTLIKEKMARLAEEEGFLLCEVSNAFRSQRCFECGFVRKANRKSKTFKCTSAVCSHTADADLNAACNLSLDLPWVPKWVRLEKRNRAGFYWTADGCTDSGGELIVPHTAKAK
jgi:hypothetical protein